MESEERDKFNSFIKDLEWTPTKYDLLFNISNPIDYQGQCIVTVDCVNPTNVISFDSVELKVSEVQVDQKKWKGTIKFFEDTKLFKLKILLRYFIT